MALEVAFNAYDLQDYARRREYYFSLEACEVMLAHAEKQQNGYFREFDFRNLEDFVSGYAEYGDAEGCEATEEDLIADYRKRIHFRRFDKNEETYNSYITSFIEALEDHGLVFARLDWSILMYA